MSYPVKKASKPVPQPLVVVDSILNKPYPQTAAHSVLSTTLFMWYHINRGCQALVGDHSSRVPARRAMGI